MPVPDEKIYMTWSMFDDDIEEFIKYIKKYNFDKDSVVLAIKRGGFPTAVSISNKADIPISVISYQTRDGDNNLKFLEPELIKKAKRVIIPDDIYDSGLTIENIIEVLRKEFNISTKDIVGLFHYSTENIYKTKLEFYQCIRDNHKRWVVMPWEKGSRGNNVK